MNSYYFKNVMSFSKNHFFCKNKNKITSIL
jgi:hypothetical protein